MAKNILCAVLILFGVLLFISGSRQASLAMQGEQQLMQSQPVERRPTLGPVRRNAHAQENQAVQQQRMAASNRILSTQFSASQMRIGGIILIIAGLGYLFFIHKKGR
jgi:hypothetical protein